jgi:hypothetical protein
MPTFLVGIFISLVRFYLSDFTVIVPWSREAKAIRLASWRMCES